MKIYNIVNDFIANKHGTEFFADYELGELRNLFPFIKNQIEKLELALRHYKIFLDFCTKEYSKREGIDHRTVMKNFVNIPDQSSQYSPNFGSEKFKQIINAFGPVGRAKNKYNKSDRQQTEQPIKPNLSNASDKKYYINNVPIRKNDMFTTKPVPDNVILFFS